MRLSLTTLSLWLAGSCVCLAQSVNGPGDDVLCSGYSLPPRNATISYRGFTNHAFFQPPPIPATTGRPYSARRVAQDLQIRQDGTKICGMPQIFVIYRDSAGRTRQEDGFYFAATNGKAARITIMDPVAQVEYVLDTVTQTAYRVLPLKRADIKPASPGSPMPPDPAITTKTESLGKHLFEGVEVEGQRITTTGTPPGSSAPISVTNEVWRSPDLNLVVLQKSVNPAASRTDAYLRITTAEPDPGLFRVPDGWKIVDAGSSANPGGGGTSRQTTAGYEYTIHIAPPTRTEYRVIGAPYSAVRTETTASNLAGTAGRPISLSGPTKLYRDPYGRTRIETPRTGSQPGDALGPPIFPEINDVVDGVQIILDPVHKIAHRFPLPEPSTIPPANIATAGNGHPHAVETSQDLGESTINGIKVEGTLETFRTPAGAIGNDRELTETTESWYSPELRVLVRAKFDMTTQKSEWELTNISTEEPDQTLFDIPAGYSIVDDKAPFTIDITHR